MPLLQYNDDDDNDGLTQEWRPQMYTGPNFLTKPDPTQYPTDPTETDPRIFGKETTRSNPTQTEGSSAAQ